MEFTNGCEGYSLTFSHEQIVVVVRLRSTCGTYLGEMKFYPEFITA